MTGKEQNENKTKPKTSFSKIYILREQRKNESERESRKKTEFK